MSSPIASVVHLEQKQTSGVETAIRQASQKTGVEFSYLLAQATAESGLNPNAKAGTSTAAGLYQFIERTWLDMVDRHGAKYGLDKQATLISRDDSGRPVVTGTAKDRKAILDLRYDAEIAALMAGEYAAENRNYLEGALSQKVEGADLYFAHFLGGGGAARFLRALKSNPQQAAANVMPEAAAANYNVFYDKSGKARSLQQVYDRFEAKFSDVDLASAPVSTAVQATTSVVVKPENKLAAANIETIRPQKPDLSRLAGGAEIDRLGKNSVQPATSSGYWQHRGAMGTVSAFAHDATVRSLLRVLETDRDGLVPVDDEDRQQQHRQAAEMLDQAKVSSRFGMQGYLLGNLLQAQIEGYKETF